MRNRWILGVMPWGVALLAVAVLTSADLAAASGALPARAASVGPTGLTEVQEPRVVAASLSARSVNVSGFSLLEVSVTVSVVGWPSEPGVAVLSRTSGVRQGIPGSLRAPLHRTSGTPGSGTYTGIFHIPSTADGRWVLDDIIGGDVGRSPTRDDGLPAALLTVHGTHLPVLRNAVIPNPIPYGETGYTIVTTVTDEQSGQPLTGIPVDFVEITTEPGARSTATTNRSGRAAHRYSDPADVEACAVLPFPADAQAGGAYVDGCRPVRHAVRLSAAPGRTVVAPAASTRVAGNVVGVGITPRSSGALYPTIYLQRLVGRAWRTVNRATIRSSGRYGLMASPPRRARNTYRVWFPSQYSFAGTVTRGFTITVR